MQTPNFTYINTSQLEIAKHQNFLTNGLFMKMKNSSMLIHIKPDSVNIGYFVWAKVGSIPYANKTHKNYDTFQSFCPSGIINYKIFFYVIKNCL